jgi:hypothetical protein|tara:strand:+ start:80 stop:304 length:225 start_codon:yes stop_codon:yes gene_type:complete
MYLSDKDIKKVKTSQLIGERNSALDLIYKINIEIESRHQTKLEWWRNYGECVSANRPNTDDFAIRYADNIQNEE